MAGWTVIPNPDPTSAWTPVENTAPLSPQITAPAASMGPQQQTLSNWFDNAGNDLRSGGARTAIGKILGVMQGRGDKGYTGLESGVSPAAADFMGSLPLGLTQMGKGAAQSTEGHPISGVGNVVGGALKASTIPMMFAGGPVADAAIGSIPSKAYAVQKLNEVADAAQNVPVTMQNTVPALEEFLSYVKTGGRNNQVIRKLAARIDPEAIAPNPVNFPEARQFYTNVSRATARPGFLRRAIESPSAPDMRRNLGGVREAMNNDLTATADSVGMGDQYTQAMNEYKNAATLSRVLKYGGALATGEILRRSGILGKVISSASSMAGGGQ